MVGLWAQSGQALNHLPPAAHDPKQTFPSRIATNVEKVVSV
jgi:hypothetical protein